MTRYQLRALPMVLLLITITVLLVTSLISGRKHAQSPARTTAELSWGGALRVMDDALSKGNISAAYAHRMMRT